MVAWTADFAWRGFDTLTTMAGGFSDIPSMLGHQLISSLDLAKGFSFVWANAPPVLMVVGIALMTQDFWQPKLLYILPNWKLIARFKDLSALEEGKANIGLVNQHVEARVRSIEKNISTLSSRLDVLENTPEHPAISELTGIKAKIEACNATLRKVQISAERGSAVARKIKAEADLKKWDSLLKAVTYVPEIPQIFDQNDAENQDRNQRLIMGYHEKISARKKKIYNCLDSMGNFDLFIDKDFEQNILKMRNEIEPVRANSTILASDEGNWTDGRDKLAYMLMVGTSRVQASFVKKKIDEVKKRISEATTLINSCDE